MSALPMSIEKSEDNMLPSVAPAPRESSKADAASRHVAPPSVEKLQAENQVLRAFARLIIQEGPWQGADLDGGTIQEWAEEAGLIKCVPFDPEKHITCVEQQILDAGEDWYVFAGPLARVSDEQSKTEDAVAAEPIGCQRGGEAETPHPLPLLSDNAFQAGAEAMREKAARRADGFSNATGRTIARDIRSLPLPIQKEG